MPLPTTRNGRYLYRRARYLRRMKKQRNAFLRSGPAGSPPLHQGHAGGVWLSNGKPQRSMPALYSNPAFFGPVPFFTPYTIEGGGWYDPPHPTFIHPLPEWATNHPSFAHAGAQRRAVRWLGHKVGRLNGAQRVQWYAWSLWKAYGLFPSWDPLHRHPNEDD